MLKVKIYSPFVVLVFSIFFGGFGIDRFYIGDTKLGILKIFFGWFTLGIWTLVDIILCYLKAKEKNFNNFCAILSESNILA